jgi:DNA-binding HxlR family transcriptional regulator
VTARSYGQYCGVTSAVEVVAERWALLIVRDLLVGPRRYSDLKRGLPRIPTNILSARLKELQEADVVRRVPLVHRGPVYELTPYGLELEPIVLALGRWGFARMGEPAPGDVVTPDSLTMALRTAWQPDAVVLPPTGYEVHVGEVALRADVGRDGLQVVQLAPSLPRAGGAPTAADPDLRFAAGPRIRDLISGALPPAAAIEAGVVHVLDGDPLLLDRFARTFHIPLAA